MAVFKQIGLLHIHVSLLDCLLGVLHATDVGGDDFIYSLTCARVLDLLTCHPVGASLYSMRGGRTSI